MRLRRQPEKTRDAWREPTSTLLSRIAAYDYDQAVLNTSQDNSASNGTQAGPGQVSKYRVRTFHMEVGCQKSYGWERDYVARFVAASLESATRIAQAEADKTGLTVVLYEVPIRSGNLTSVGTFRP